MTGSLQEMKVALLVANGFDENHITALQRALTKAKISSKVIAPEQGLVNGWQDKAWGHYFTVDASINTALGSDHDVLILIGGERSAEKLKANLHARRIINHFVDAEKPIAAIGAGVGLLMLSNAMAGRCVACSDEIHDEVESARIKVSENDQETDGFILTSSGADVEDWVESTLALISDAAAVQEEQRAA